MTTDSTPRAADRRGSASVLVRALGSYSRRNPMTCGYLLLIVTGLLVLGRMLPGPTADRVKLAISTNPHNLAHDPLFVLLASPLVSATDSGLLSHLLVIGVGVGLCLAALERRFGALRAAAIFLLGNTVATAVATSVAAAAIHSGRYPAQWWSGYDYGISYGVLAVAAAVAPLIHGRRGRMLWTAAVFAYPFADARWYGALPNFSTIGHLTAAGFGLAAGYVVFRSASSVRPESRLGAPGWYR